MVMMDGGAEAHGSVMDGGAEVPLCAAGGAEAPPYVPGAGRIEVVRQGRRSVVTRAYAASPLRLLTPRSAGDAAWVFTSSFGGGLVDGDRVALEIDVRGSGAALLSTQASTKVYRSPGGVSTTLRARVEDDGLLVLLPDPVVPFRDSRYVQEQTCDLARGGRLIALDWVSSGRRESGERWAFTDYRARLRVRVDGRRVLEDVLHLREEDGPLAARLGQFDVLAVVVVIGAPLLPIVDAATAAAGPVERHPATLVGRARIEHLSLGDVGRLLRVAGPSVQAVATMIREYLSFVPALLGDDPWARKW